MHMNQAHTCTTECMDVHACVWQWLGAGYVGCTVLSTSTDVNQDTTHARTHVKAREGEGSINIVTCYPATITQGKVIE